METQAFHLHLNESEASLLKLRKSSEVDEVDWKPITRASLADMYGSHGALVKQAGLLWQKENGLVVAQDATVGRPSH